MVTKIKEEFKLQGETLFLYMDGSKNDDGRKVGIGVYKEGDEEGIGMAIVIGLAYFRQN